MFAILIVLAALTGNVFSTALSKCDENIVNKIKASWNGNEPTGLIQTALEHGKEVVVGTTKGYYSEDTIGTFSYFVQERSNPLTRVDIYQILKNGTLVGKNIHIKEEKGTLYDPESQVRRYHIYQDTEGGVTGLYACSESASAESGTPAGIVKARAFDYKEESLTKAINILKNVGVEITTKLTIN